MANNTVATQPQKAVPPVEGASETQQAAPEKRWDEYWDGQRQINGLLFEAETKIITAILELKNAVVKALEPKGLEADLSLFYQAIKEARALAGQVPAVDPPGCIPPGGGGYSGGGGSGNGQS